MLVARREGRKIAANSGILIEQLINPAWHDGEIAANWPFVTDAIFQPDGATYFYINISWFSLNISPKVKCHQFDGRDYCDFFFTHRVYKPTVHLNVVMCDADDDTLLFLAAAARNVIWWRHLSPCTHQTGQKLSMSSVRLSVKMYSWTFKTARIWLQIAIHASALDESWAKRHKTCSFVIAILNVF